MDNVLTFKKKKSSAIELSKAETKVWAILDSTATDAYMMAETYDVSHQTVRNVKMLRTERALRVAQIMRDHGVEPKTWDGARRFAAEEVEAIRADTRNSKKIAEEYGVSSSTIRMLKTGKTYVS